MKSLRVTHIPQVPMKGFIKEVRNEREAFLLYMTFAEQHLFLYQNNVIPDYSNAVIVEQKYDGSEEWEDFWDDENSLEWDEYITQFEDQLS